MAIRYENSDGIAVITIDRPEKLNALTLAMYRDLGEAFLAAKHQEHVKVVVLTGAGDRSFCVGADLGESIPALAHNEIDISAWDGAHLKHVELYKPLICAVNGLCLGGGFEIMLATDIRIASEEAVFSLPEPGIGIVPAGGTLVRLTRQIAQAHAMELLLTAGRFSARRLYEMGVLNKVVPQGAALSAAIAQAEQIRRLSASALRVVKESAIKLRDLPFAEAFALEARYGQIAFTSADAKKGLAAFAARRPVTYD